MEINTGDTAWVLASSALVLLMTPGLAFFYGGMVRRKNILGVLAQCFMAMCLISLQWVLFGYSLSFAPGNAFIGGLDWVLLKGVGFTPNADYAGTIPHQAFMIFQAMFAIITPALIIGSFAERMKFSAFIFFLLLWATFVYDPICHMVWSCWSVANADGTTTLATGLIRGWGALDFAGGTVVHINAGIAGLALALAMGKRVGYENKPTPIHNLPFTVLGVGLLWFGWFGFNAGSALAANGLATSAFVVTNTAAAAAGLSWALVEWLKTGKPTMLGVASGAVAGLVAITPASGFVDVTGAIVIGFAVSVICFFAVSVIKPMLGYDDSLDAFGVHCIGGIWGALATGLFATKVINSAGNDGLFFGNPALLLIQVKAVLATLIYSFVVTFIIYKIVDMVCGGARVSPEDEVIGLDLTQHHERAYTMLE